MNGTFGIVSLDKTTTEHGRTGPLDDDGPAEPPVALPADVVGGSFRAATVDQGRVVWDADWPCMYTTSIIVMRPS